MSDAEKPSHADGAPPSSNVPEPTLAEKAKTLTVQGGKSSLSTMSRKHSGYPFGSIMPYGLTEEGEPTFLISSMAMHTRNVTSDPRATLLITQATNSPNPLGAGRISLMGDVHLVEGEDEIGRVASNYLQRNPEAENWMHFGDFKFFRMTLLDVYFVGGFGIMGWISVTEFKAAKSDPLAPFADGIIQHMNEDHRDSMTIMSKSYSGLHATDAEMTSVDRLGFNMRVMTAEGMKGSRIAFPEPIDSMNEVRRVFVDMVKSAREKLG